MSKSRQQTLSSRRQQGYRLIVVGLIFLITAFSFRIYQKWESYALSFTQAPSLSSTVSLQDIPSRIKIAKYNIDLPVSAGQIHNGIWQISATGASYLIGSGEIGKSGNAIIYGHNKNSIFGPIRWLQKGDDIIITGDGGDYRYQVFETKTVDPDAVGVLLPTSDSTLTLYTCTGFMDRQRFVIIAKLANQ
jgi:LPXTG-site transpeptidase (sortase) family protein